MNLSAELRTQARVGVAYSGGRDSTALLHATARMARELGGIDVVAFHVHHGLSAHADTWLQHAQAQCAAWQAQGLPVRLQWAHLRLQPGAGDSIEAFARQARYASLSRLAVLSGCDTVWLAHHRQDQAETFLLQALRGAGVAGLAAMPRLIQREGIMWCRPWLDHPRASIEAYVQAHGLSHIEDDSNVERRFARNRLRLDVWPALMQAFPQAGAALTQAASHQADVLACVQDWLTDKLPLVTEPCGDTGRLALDVAAWRQYGPGPQRELLRAWFRGVSDMALPASWVHRLQSEIDGPDTGRWPMALKDVSGHLGHGELVLYRGLLNWRAGRVAPVQAMQAHQAEWPVCITGPGRWPLPHALGSLEVAFATGSELGLPLAKLGRCVLKRRQGGERFQMGLDRPARSLKKQFQMLGLPAWAREGPLLWAGNELLFVPGLGINAPARALSAQQMPVTLRWVPPCADQDNISVTE